MMNTFTPKDSWTGVVEVQEVRHDWANLYLQRGYVLLAIFNMPWYKDGAEYWNIVFVVGRYSTVPAYMPPQRWPRQPEEGKMGETMG